MSDVIFDTRTLMRAVYQHTYPKTFILNRFFVPEAPADTENVEVDIVKNGTVMAPFISPISDGKVVRKNGYSTKTFKPAYLHPKKVLTPKDLASRLPGENPYIRTASPSERLAAKVGIELGELNNSVERRKEFMAAQALVEGKTIVTGDDVDYEVDYQRDANHSIVLAGTALWSDAEAEPISNMRAWSDLISRAGYQMDTILMAHDVVGHFFKNSETKDWYATNGYAVAGIKPEKRDDGAVSYGVLPEFGEAFSYNEYYLPDDEDNESASMPLIPSGYVVLGASASQKLYYGAIQNLKVGGMAAMEKFTYAEDIPNGKGKILHLESSPLTALTAPNAIVVVKVL